MTIQRNKMIFDLEPKLKIKGALSYKGQAS